MKKRKLGSILMAGLLGLGVAVASEARSWKGSRDVEIEIVDDSGREFRQYPLSGAAKKQSTRAYLEAERGENYGIRVRNRSDHRVGLVIAVDGRNILSGKRSGLARNEKKYILGPHETATYQGWRTSRSRVHRFYFTDAADSYAEAFGDRTAMGVIAVAVYREKLRRSEPPRQPYSEGPRGPRSKRAPAPGTQGEGRRPGTGFGESESSPSHRVAFKPENKPSMRRFLKYEWRPTLCRKGVIACRRPYPDNRFWPEDEWAMEDDGFAPHPPRDRKWLVRRLSQGQD